MSFLNRLFGVFLLLAFSLQAKLVELIKINPSFKLDVRYATTNNFTGKQVYPTNRCFLQEPAALALDKAQKDLKEQGLGLVVYDAYRRKHVQEIFWGICPDERYVADPAKGSKHNRGCAVDVSLVDLKTGKELAMPSEFDDFSAQASRNYDAMAPETRKNCKLLEDIMTKSGFAAPYSEWWHFDFVGIGAKPGEEVWRQYPVSDIDIEYEIFLPN